MAECGASVKLFGQVISLPATGEGAHDGARKDETTPAKKPEKVLPCPRCSSMDTKFCYYNNYNVKQPRHFCRNCQRYWTAGGSMRNVPVGAGRRKSKSKSKNMNTAVTITQDPNLAFCQLRPCWIYPWWTATGVAVDPPPTAAPPPPSTLGKHPREEAPTSNGLTMDDPDDVARSSVFATVGRIAGDKAGGFSHCGLFGAFQSKPEKSSAKISNSAAAALHANPAALARSVNLNECT